MRVTALKRDGGEWVIETDAGVIRARRLINCAGLYSDEVARRAGCRPPVRIVPFRGEYYKLAPQRESLVKGLIYPVPDPAFPFLGVHFTRMIRGGVEAGPNAVLSFKREGYRKTDFDAREAWSTLSFPGFWRLASKYWRTGAGEFYRSFSKAAFVRALQRLLPELRACRPAARRLRRARPGDRAERRPGRRLLASRPSTASSTSSTPPRPPPPPLFRSARPSRTRPASSSQGERVGR